MSTPKFVVIVKESGTVFGPFGRTEAGRFAEFLTTEVDPAEVRMLCSPVLELLNWRDNVAVRLDWPPGLITAKPCTPADPAEGVRLLRQGQLVNRLSPREAFKLAGELITAAITTEEEPPF